MPLIERIECLTASERAYLARRTPATIARLLGVEWRTARRLMDGAKMGGPTLDKARDWLAKQGFYDALE